MGVGRTISSAADAALMRPLAIEHFVNILIMAEAFASFDGQDVDFMMLGLST